MRYQANVLWWKISSWISVQHLYIPSLHVVHDHNDHCSPPHQPEELVSNIKLYLPSAINVISKVACDDWLCHIEFDLHQAQAHDALHELHDNLRLRSHVYADKDCFQWGQHQSTHSWGLLDCLEVKVSTVAAKYCTAHHAISTLAPSLHQVGWEVDFPALNDSDIKGLTDSSTPSCSHPSEGYWDITWIWKQLETLETSDKLLLFFLFFLDPIYSHLWWTICERLNTYAILSQHSSSPAKHFLWQLLGGCP